MPTKGTEYELFVKSVYKCLNSADGLSDVHIQHDIKLKGATGVKHQIDVFWTFTIGGVCYKVAVECKDYNRHVSKEKIAAFHDILQDIGNIYGIFASKMGFQSGAIQYAMKYGIQLMEIRKPIDSDWEGRIKDIHVQLCMRSIGEIHPHIFVNKALIEEWGIVLPHDNQLNAMTDHVSINFGEMKVGQKTVEKNGSTTMYELIQELPVNEPGKGYKFVYLFKNAEIKLENATLPVDRIEFTYDIHESKRVIDIYGDESIMAIVKNITEGSEKHIDKFGRVNVREFI